MENIDFNSLMEEPIRKSPLFGIQFGIEPKDFKANVRITIKPSSDEISNGTYKNNQILLYRNKYIGLLFEWYHPGKFFDDPIRHQFLVPLSDEVSDAERSNPHFLEDEWNYMAFSSLQEMLDYLGIKQGKTYRLRKRK